MELHEQEASPRPAEHDSTWDTIAAFRKLMSEVHSAKSDDKVIKVDVIVSGKGDKTVRAKFYRPFEFAEVIKTFKLKPKSIVKSFPLPTERIDKTKSAGKSGSEFIFSGDKKFMLKTLIKEEKETLIDRLPRYVQYMKDNSEGTFITRMYFLGSIGKGNSKTYFCMFNNIFNNPEMKPDSVYDLKGSIHNRKTANLQKRDVRMDLDLDRKFDLGEKEESVLKQIDADAKFLASLHVMDYSFLIGVSPLPRKTKPKKNKLRELNETTQFKWDKGIVSGDKSDVFFVGIIDILQDYNSKKKAAHFFKSIAFGSAKISTVEPNLYADRFVKYLHTVPFENSKGNSVD